jgi:hypothetical protein
MFDWLILLLFIIAYFLLMKYVLPRLGFST